MGDFYLNEQEQLQAFCDRARAQGQFGLDLEFIPENTFYPKLALIQLAVDDALVLVDPLRRLNLSPLYDLVAHPDVTVVVHAGSQDMAILVHQSGKLPRRVFDIQVAGAFMGFGHQISYGQMVSRLFNVTLAKSESFSDWLRRPLSPKQENYALDDVRFLLPAATETRKRLEALGRQAWVEDELRDFEQNEMYDIDPADGWLRVKRGRDLKGRDLEVLKSVALWREHEAIRRDLPRRKVIDDETILEVAKAKPVSVDELARIRGLSKNVTRDCGPAIVEAVARGVRMPETQRERSAGRMLDESGETVADYLIFCFKAVCASLEIAPAVVGTRAEVEALVLDFLNGGLSPERHRLLRGWRREAVGVKLLECLEGRVSVKMNPEKRRVEFE